MGNAVSGSNHRTHRTSCRVVQKKLILTRNENNVKYSIFKVNFQRGAEYDDDGVAFVYEADSVPTCNANISDNCGLKMMKCLRHPNIVKCIDWTVDEGHLWLICENIEPLSDALPVLEHEESIILGIHSILEAYSFLHTKATVCHASGGISSLYMTADGCWKLGNFERAVPFAKLSRQKVVDIETSKAKNANDISDSVIAFSPDRPDAYDVYQFGQMVLDVLEATGCKDEQLLSFARVMENSCMHLSVHERPTVDQLLCHNVFKHPYVQVTQFLRNFTIKSSEEKAAFFSHLKRDLFSLPEELVARHLSHLLLSRLVLIDPYARDHLLPYLLTPYTNVSRPADASCLLSADACRRHILPRLAMILHIRERHVRLAITPHIGRLAPLWGADAARRLLLPQLLAAVTDAHDPLVAVTLEALSRLVTVTGGAGAVLAGLRLALGAAAPTKAGTVGEVPRRCLFPEAGPASAPVVGALPVVISAPAPQQMPAGATSPTSRLRDLAHLSPNYKAPLPCINAADTASALLGGNDGDSENRKKQEDRIAEREQRRLKMLERREARRKAAASGGGGSDATKFGATVACGGGGVNGVSAMAAMASSDDGSHATAEVGGRLNGAATPPRRHDIVDEMFAELEPTISTTTTRAGGAVTTAADVGDNVTKATLSVAGGETAGVGDNATKATLAVSAAAATGGDNVTKEMLAAAGVGDNVTKETLAAMNGDCALIGNAAADDDVELLCCDPVVASDVDLVVAAATAAGGLRDPVDPSVERVDPAVVTEAASAWQGDWSLDESDSEQPRKP